MNLFQLCAADGDANFDSASLTVRDPDGNSFEKIEFPGRNLDGRQAQAAALASLPVKRAIACTQQVKIDHLGKKVAISKAVLGTVGAGSLAKHWAALAGVVVTTEAPVESTNPPVKEPVSLSGPKLSKKEKRLIAAQKKAQAAELAAQVEAARAAAAEALNVNGQTV